MRELSQVVPATDPEVINRNKREHMEKFLKSQPGMYTLLSFYNYNIHHHMLPTSFYRCPPAQGPN